MTARRRRRGSRAASGARIRVLGGVLAIPLLACGASERRGSEARPRAPLAAAVRAVGEAHPRDWLTRHRWVAADPGATCADCHVERECAECHDGRVRPARVHAGDYLYAHPADAARGAPRCTGCHTVQSFCAECHARLGLASLASPDARLRGRYHPPATEWLRGPGGHADEARRRIESCASCHAEADCVECHGARGVGAGVSPHPRAFAGACASLLERGAEACRRCHGDLAAVRRACE